MLTANATATPSDLTFNSRALNFWKYTVVAMATLADELLNDFEESEPEDEGQNDLRHDDDVDGEPGERADSMEIDGDKERITSEDAEASETLGEGVAEDEAKAQVEKMQLGTVADVRSVARLMKTLQPILDVSGFDSPLNWFSMRVYRVSESLCVCLHGRL